MEAGAIGSTQPWRLMEQIFGHRQLGCQPQSTAFCKDPKKGSVLTGSPACKLPCPTPKPKHCKACKQVKRNSSEMGRDEYSWQYFGSIQTIFIALQGWSSKQ